MNGARLDHLKGRDFQRLAQFIHNYSGIKMPPTKKTMVEGRLRKRASANGFASLTDYCAHLFDQGGLEAESIHLIDAVTTNKTEFFREPEHFRFLTDVAVPELTALRRPGAPVTLKVWSAASSIGAEPYTLAMALADLAERRGGFRFSITGTDISTRVLETAIAAIYPEQMIEPVPMALRKRFLLRSRDARQDLVRIAPELRSMVQFGRVNLMEAPYAVDRDMDVVFCRNILIYFDKPTQQEVLERLCDHLRPGGFLFLGHSESLAGLGLPLEPAGPTVFRRL
ncbi:MAG TPA: protein-glutamate O-methyltransferase [Aliidongia sp.]|nr:protein-glutamate O-methyltransferase [Aliidongia sp.]